MLRINRFSRLALAIFAAGFLSACLFSVPYSSHTDVPVDKNLVGDWTSVNRSEKDYCRVQITERDKYTYKIKYEQVSAFVGAPLRFDLNATGHLIEACGQKVGQFRIDSFESADKGSNEDVGKIVGGYILGVFEDIDKDSFCFSWLHSESLGVPINHPHLTADGLKEIVDRHLETGEFRKNRLCFKRRKKAPSWCSKESFADPCLEGRWLVRSAKKDGREVSRLENMKFVFSGNKLLIKNAWREGDDEGCFFTVNDEVSPHHLSFSELDDQVPVKGIYECSGNALKLCIRDESSNKGRPAVFGSAPESDLLMLEFSRIE